MTFTLPSYAGRFLTQRHGRLYTAPLGAEARHSPFPVSLPGPQPPTVVTNVVRTDDAGVVPTAREHNNPHRLKRAAEHSPSPAGRRHRFICPRSSAPACDTEAAATVAQVLSALVQAVVANAPAPSSTPRENAEEQRAAGEESNNERIQKLVVDGSARAKCRPERACRERHDRVELIVTQPMGGPKAVKTVNGGKCSGRRTPLAARSSNGASPASQESEKACVPILAGREQRSTAKPFGWGLAHHNQEYQRVEMFRNRYLALLRRQPKEECRVRRAKRRQGQAAWVCKGLHFLRSLVRRRSRDNAKRMPETIVKLHPFAWAGLRHASRIVNSGEALAQYMAAEPAHPIRVHVVGAGSGIMLATIARKVLRAWLLVATCDDIARSFRCTMTALKCFHMWKHWSYIVSTLSRLCGSIKKTFSPRDQAIQEQHMAMTKPLRSSEISLHGWSNMQDLVSSVEMLASDTSLHLRENERILLRKVALTCRLRWTCGVRSCLCAWAGWLRAPARFENMFRHKCCEDRRAAMQTKRRRGLFIAWRKHVQQMKRFRGWMSRQTTTKLRRIGISFFESLARMSALNRAKTLLVPIARCITARTFLIAWRRLHATRLLARDFTEAVEVKFVRRHWEEWAECAWTQRQFLDLLFCSWAEQVFGDKRRRKRECHEASNVFMRMVMTRKLTRLFRAWYQHFAVIRFTRAIALGKPLAGWFDLVQWHLRALSMQSTKFLRNLTKKSFLAWHLVSGELAKHRAWKWTLRQARRSKILCTFRAACMKQQHRRDKKEDALCIAAAWAHCKFMHGYFYIAFVHWRRTVATTHKLHSMQKKIALRQQRQILFSLARKVYNRYLMVKQQGTVLWRASRAWYQLINTHKWYRSCKHNCLQELLLVCARRQCAKLHGILVISSRAFGKWQLSTTDAAFSRKSLKLPRTSDHNVNDGRLAREQIRRAYARRDVFNVEQKAGQRACSAFGLSMLRSHGSSKS